MLSLLLLFLPLCGSVAAAIFQNKRFAQIITSICVLISAVLSYSILYEVVISGHVIKLPILEWLRLDALTLHWAIYIDSLSAIMLSVVTTISAVVHIYSIGYMDEDKTVPKYMSFISLFTFFMLVLVVSDNLLQLFFGWEGVGLCSYLLIGYWYEKEAAYKAGIKAFLVNRIADVFFIIGIIAIYVTFESLSFDIIFQSSASHNVDFICLMIFIGCMGKSAQLFFHTWLPDAMEGPTPVSALIHAATMVTAGVFLVARMSFLFEHSPLVLAIITIIGAGTCLFAATIACVNNDIKKIIAYSTCSQLGYMFMASGLSAYTAGIFHLGTHAFFKALLFLCAGNVIHALNGEQDIRNMGGIRSKMPITYFAMLVGFCALSGIYPFSGYFSKHAIIEAAYSTNNNVGKFAYIIGILTAVLTAFYSFRLFILTFHGESKTHPVVHEASKLLIAPVLFLAMGSIVVGFISERLGVLDVTKFWHNSIHQISYHDSSSNFIVKNLSIISALLGIIGAFLMYYYKNPIRNTLKKYLNILYVIYTNKYYFDEIYDFVFVRPLAKISSIIDRIIETKIIDRYGPNGFSFLSQGAGQLVTKIQNGLIYNYALVMLVGIMLFLLFILLNLI